MSNSIQLGRRRLIILVPDPVEELDVAGPLAVFAHANRLLAHDNHAYEIQLVGTSQHSSVRGDCRLWLNVPLHYKTVRGPVDTLLVAGGNGAIESDDRPLIDWIVKISQRARRIGSICTGAFLLARAGLLDGRRATTHWLESKHLAALFPRVKVDSDAIWVRDGNVHTSAGITAGIDLALALLEEDYGAKTVLGRVHTIPLLSAKAEVALRIFDAPEHLPEVKLKLGSGVVLTRFRTDLSEGSGSQGSFGWRVCADSMLPL